MSDLIDRQGAIDAITDELDRIDHVPQWVFDRLEERLKQLPPAQLGTNLADVGTDSISRQAAIDAFGLSEKTRKYGGDHSGYDTRMLYEIQDILEGLPPAQPELIRCKDCKYSEHWYKDKTRCFLWHETGIDVFEDGYCNYAKRRTVANMRGEQE